MRRAGVSATGVLIVVVLLAAGFILYFINSDVRGEQAKSEDIHNMRKIYVAATLYEDLNDTLPPPSLDKVRMEIDSPLSYLATGDPNKTGSDFPVDPAFPDSTQRSNFRISFTYLPQWVAHDKYPVKNWKDAMQEPSLGFIACYWYGDFRRPDGLDATGNLTRINMDGSAQTISRAKPNELLDAQSLFSPQKRTQR